MVALLGIGLLLVVLGLGLLLPVLVVGGILQVLGLVGIMLGLWGIFLGLGLGLLLLGLRLGLLDLALLNWLGLTEGVCQLGIVDHQIVLLVGLRVIDHLDFGLRLGRVEVASCIGHSEAASHLRLLGAGIELRAGDSGLARGLPAWRIGGGRGCAEPEGLALLLEPLGGRADGPLLVVELGPESVEVFSNCSLSPFMTPARWSSTVFSWSFCCCGVRHA